ncbi:IPT/TIG domain-containing protein [Bacteroides thetaiotaomicron]|uniref:IPT/TIG domain-containing protein n=1 Tax=Bacteroides thetaiotaomicron TaxID=818 RepID=UPI00216683B3|nr:IPT/TIG domain-containing protein [Bacteroides thetaiotaomicron]MCS3195334.1 IPT/TIG domain-containing protein [Bacteroides thetaiotaomicron]
MRNCIFYSLVLALLFLIGSCKDSDDNKSTGATYDPNQPVTVESFMPVGGKLREKVIVKGSNFGTDKSKVKVYFVDDAAERLSTVIGIDNNTLYCLAPRQLPGGNRIKVIVDGKEVTTDGTFKYEQAQNVSTISGSASKDGNDDGDLASAKFKYMWGIAAVGNNTVLAYQRDDPRVRLISVDDNKVTTVHPGFKGGKPAVTKDKQRVYSIGWEGTHTVYVYMKASGWAPTRIGQLGSTFSGKIGAVALDETEEWLYFVDSNKNFGRFNVKTQEVTLIKQLELSGSLGTNPGPYLIYYFVDSNFYMSDQNLSSVYKITPDGECEWFCGSATQKTVQDGLREEALFAQPNGMTVDEDGNFYIVDGFKGYCLRKLDILDGYVSTVAGQVDVASQIDGTPLEATFNYPYDICYDGEGGYWIAEAWGKAIRKYAVE